MSEQKMIGYKCEYCGIKIYPKREICPKCRKSEFTELEINEIGKVVTFTKLYAVPDGIDEKPLILGIVDFNGIRITGQIADSKIKIGDKVEPFWGKLRESQGKKIYGFKFKMLNHS
jgi:uncharacterized OB-fold protein